MSNWFKRRKYELVVQGRTGSYGFTIEGTPDMAKVWRAEGFEVHEVMYSIPGWVVELGLARDWALLQDLFYMRRPRWMPEETIEKMSPDGLNQIVKKGDKNES